MESKVKKRRRSSILKRSPHRKSLGEIDSNCAEFALDDEGKQGGKRRVSFANTFQVKEIVRIADITQKWADSSSDIDVTNISNISKLSQDLLLKKSCAEPNTSALNNLLSAPLLHTDVSNTPMQLNTAEVPMTEANHSNDVEVSTSSLPITSSDSNSLCLSESQHKSSCQIKFVEQNLLQQSIVTPSFLLKNYSSNITTDLHHKKISNDTSSPGLELIEEMPVYTPSFLTKCMPGEENAGNTFCNKPFNNSLGGKFALENPSLNETNLNEEDMMETICISECFKDRTSKIFDSSRKVTETKENISPNILPFGVEISTTQTLDKVLDEKASVGLTSNNSNPAHDMVSYASSCDKISELCFKDTSVSKSSKTLDQSSNDGMELTCVSLSSRNSGIDKYLPMSTESSGKNNERLVKNSFASKSDKPLDQSSNDGMELTCVSLSSRNSGIDKYLPMSTESSGKNNERLIKNSFASKSDKPLDQSSNDGMELTCVSLSSSSQVQNSNIDEYHKPKSIESSGKSNERLVKNSFASKSNKALDQSRNDGMELTCVSLSSSSQVQNSSIDEYDKPKSIESSGKSNERLVKNSFASKSNKALDQSSNDGMELTCVFLSSSSQVQNSDIDEYHKPKSIESSGKSNERLVKNSFASKSNKPLDQSRNDGMELTCVFLSSSSQVQNSDIDEYDKPKSIESSGKSNERLVKNSYVLTSNKTLDQSSNDGMELTCVSLSSSSQVQNSDIDEYDKPKSIESSGKSNERLIKNSSVLKSNKTLDQTRNDGMELTCVNFSSIPHHSSSSQTQNSHVVEKNHSARFKGSHSNVSNACSNAKELACFSLSASYPQSASKLPANISDKENRIEVYYSTRQDNTVVSNENNVTRSSLFTSHIKSAKIIASPSKLPTTLNKCLVSSFDRTRLIDEDMEETNILSSGLDCGTNSSSRKQKCEEEKRSCYALNTSNQCEPFRSISGNDDISITSPFSLSKSLNKESSYIELTSKHSSQQTNNLSTANKMKLEDSSLSAKDSEPEYLVNSDPLAMEVSECNVNNAVETVALRSKRSFDESFADNVKLNCSNGILPSENSFSRKQIKTCHTPQLDIALDQPVVNDQPKSPTACSSVMELTCVTGTSHQPSSEPAEAIEKDIICLTVHPSEKEYLKPNTVEKLKSEILTTEREKVNNCTRLDNVSLDISLVRQGNSPKGITTSNEAIDCLSLHNEHKSTLLSNQNISEKCHVTSTGMNSMDFNDGLHNKIRYHTSITDTKVSDKKSFDTQHYADEMSAANHTIKTNNEISDHKVESLNIEMNTLGSNLSLDVPDGHSTDISLRVKEGGDVISGEGDGLLVQNLSANVTENERQSDDIRSRTENPGKSGESNNQSELRSNDLLRSLLTSMTDSMLLHKDSVNYTSNITVGEFLREYTDVRIGVYKKCVNYRRSLILPADNVDEPRTVPTLIKAIFKQGRNLPIYNQFCESVKDKLKSLEKEIEVKEEKIHRSNPTIMEIVRFGSEAESEEAIDSIERLASNCKMIAKTNWKMIRGKLSKGLVKSIESTLETDLLLILNRCRAFGNVAQLLEKAVVEMEKESLAVNTKLAELTKKVNNEVLSEERIKEYVNNQIEVETLTQEWSECVKKKQRNDSLISESRKSLKQLEDKINENEQSDNERKQSERTKHEMLNKLKRFLMWNILEDKPRKKSFGFLNNSLVLHVYFASEDRIGSIKLESILPDTCLSMDAILRKFIHKLIGHQLNEETLNATSNMKEALHFVSRHAAAAKQLYEQIDSTLIEFAHCKFNITETSIKAHFYGRKPNLCSFQVMFHFAANVSSEETVYSYQPLSFEFVDKCAFGRFGEVEVLRTLQDVDASSNMYFKKLVSSVINMIKLP